jgi:nicotinamide riboside kinase
MTHSPADRVQTTAPVICVLGAHGTGKSTLVRELALALHQHLGLRSVCVDDALHTYRDRHGRLPRLADQASLATEQTRRIASASARETSSVAGAPSVDLIIADTSALMAAVRSEHAFGDTHLYDSALATQAGYILTLLTALDLPGPADAPPSQGAHERRQVDRLIRRALLRAGLGWSLVSGTGPARLTSALAAVQAGLAQRRADSVSTAAAADRSGLAAPSHAGWRHVCTRCGDGDCERRLFTLAQGAALAHPRHARRPA